MERELLSIYSAICAEILYRRILISDWARFASSIQDEYALNKCNKFYLDAIKAANEELTNTYEMLWQLIESRGAEEFFSNL